MIVLAEVFATMLHAIASSDSQELIAQLEHAQINALDKENVLTGLVFAMLDLWERIAHLRLVREDVDSINIVMMVSAHATQDSLEQIVILELVLMIVSDMVIASMDHAIVVQDGQVTIVH